jgi:hypothetical protein
LSPYLRCSLGLQTTLQKTAARTREIHVEVDRCDVCDTIAEKQIRGES